MEESAKNGVKIIKKGKNTLKISRGDGTEGKNWRKKPPKK